MTGTPSPLANLLADCDAHGIQLMLADDGGLTIDAPQEALTPELLERLKARKTDVLMVLHAELASNRDDAADDELFAIAPTALPLDAVCRCGSTTWRDVPIHHGQSIRRDCGRCGRFLGFPIWYGNVLDIMTSTA